MPDKRFKLEVITPDRVVVSDTETVSVVLPGAQGYLGVLANHAPLVTELGIGEVDFRRADGTSDEMAVSGGFVEVFENVVTVLAQAAEPSEEIDVRRAEQARARAKEKITSHGPNMDTERAELALKRALNRLRAARRGGGG